MKQTLLQKYYSINEALNNFLHSQSVKCPVYKYGIDPAVLKSNFKDQSIATFPYFQSYILNVRPVAWTTRESGILTEFDYQLSFFTSPKDETVNDSELFTPFEMARIAFSDIKLKVLYFLDAETGKQISIADILTTQFHYNFEMKSGSPSPSAFMLAKMRAVCSYPQETVINVPGLSTDVFSGIKFEEV